MFISFSMSASPVATYFFTAPTSTGSRHSVYRKPPETMCGRLGVLSPLRMNGEYILYIWKKGCITLSPCQKMNYENSNISPWKKIIVKKSTFNVSKAKEEWWKLIYFAPCKNIIFKKSLFNVSWGKKRIMKTHIF